MKYIDEYRDKRLIKAAADKIRDIAERGREYSFMEVCGTHTMSIARFGLKSLLPQNVRLVSGPGCPVCVSPASFIDKAVSFARLDGVIIATFGDMVKVPGARSSLEEVRAERGNVKVVYSPIDALKLAEVSPDKKVIFLGVGFETTAPAVAAGIKEAKKRNVKNYSVFCNHKIMPPALAALIKDKRVALDGFILPAHVSAIIGARPYDFISKKGGLACVIAGFEPLDVMQGIYMLIRQLERKRPEVEIQYDRVARPAGNKIAQGVLKDVFRTVDSEWRGLGVIPKSGLGIRREYARFDAEKNFKVKVPKRDRKDTRCICGDILKGLKTPGECKIFGRACTPEHPVGPCMVSSEGTCSAWYLYK